jgi:hypothetical protein
MKIRLTLMYIARSVCKKVSFAVLVGLFCSVSRSLLMKIKLSLMYIARSVCA